MARIALFRLAGITLSLAATACSQTEQEADPVTTDATASAPEPAPAPPPPATLPPSPAPPAPKVLDKDGCELIQLPGHIENPGTLGSRFVPGPVTRICPPPVVVPAARAIEPRAAYPVATAADTAGP